MSGHSAAGADFARTGDEVVRKARGLQDFARTVHGVALGDAAEADRHPGQRPPHAVPVDRDLPVVHAAPKDLDDSDWTLRAVAVQIVAQRGSADDCPALAKLFGDNREKVRPRAAAAGLQLDTAPSPVR